MQVTIRISICVDGEDDSRITSIYEFIDDENIVSLDYMSSYLLNEISLRETLATSDKEGRGAPGVHRPRSKESSMK